jgi:hypothetical protein
MIGGADCAATACGPDECARAGRENEIPSSHRAPENAKPSAVEYKAAWPDSIAVVDPAAGWRTPEPAARPSRDCVGEYEYGARPVDQERHRRGRLGPAALSRRYRRHRGPHCRDRPHPRRGRAGDRRRRADRRARLYRRPHAYGRAGRLGPDRQLLVLARRHIGRDGQLRLCAGALQAGGPGMVRPLPDGGRRHPDRGDAGRHRVELGDLPRVSGQCRTPAEGAQLRHVYRPFGAAHVCDGQARPRREGDRGRSARHGARSHRGDPGRRARLLDLARDDPYPPGWRSGRQPHRRLGGDRPSRRCDGRARFRHLPDRPRHLGRRGAARVSRAVAQGGAPHRATNHVRHSGDQAGQRPERVGLPAPLDRRDRRAGRTHMGPGDDALDQRDLLASLISAVRLPAGVARHPCPASRSRRRGCAIPNCGAVSFPRRRT